VGRVVDSVTGEAVARASLYIAIADAYGRPIFRDNAGIPTDELGEFRFYNLPPGRYYLKAQPPAPAGTAAKPGQALLATYYRSAAAVASATPIDLAPGQVLSEIAIALRRGSVYRIRGRLAGVSPGVSFSDLTLMLTPRDTNGPTGMAADLAMSETVGGTRGLGEDGSFELRNVEPGSYYLVAMRVFRRTDAYGRVPVEIANGDASGIVLPLSGPLEVSGLVQVEGAEKKLEATRVLLTPMAGEAILGTPQGQLRAGGSFQIEGVLPGKYAIGFAPRLPQNLYVKSVKLGDQEVVEQGLDLTQAQYGVKIEVTLSPKGAAVTGVVKDGEKPAAGRSLDLIPDPPRQELSLRLKSTTADENGRFSLTGVAPGSYRLYAWVEPLIGVLSDAEFLRRFQDQAVKVTVKEDDRPTIEVTLLRPEDSKAQ